MVRDFAAPEWILPSVISLVNKQLQDVADYKTDLEELNKRIENWDYAIPNNS